MTDIEQYIPTRTELDTIRDERRNAGINAIDIELAVLDKAAGVVPVLIDGGMAPDRYMPTHSPKKGSPAQGRDVALAKAMAAAVYGATLGFGVAKSLQNVFTVHGQPAIYARTAVALVQSYGHTVETVESGPTSVTVRARRKGSDHWEYSCWDMKRAAAAGFTSNNKYTSQPEEMLWAKAAMTVCRRAFADILEGIPNSVEDLQLEPVQMTAVRQDGGGRGRTGLQQALAADPTPTTDAPGGDTPPATVADFITRIEAATDHPSLKKIMDKDVAERGFNDDDYAIVAQAANKRWDDLATEAGE